MPDELKTTHADAVIDPAAGDPASVTITVHGVLHLTLSLGSGSADRKLDQLLAQQQVQTHQLEQLMSAIDDVKADLDAVTVDLAAIKTAVGSTIGAQQTQIADLQSQIAALNAGDALTASQLADLKTSADAVKVSADEALAAVQPPPTARKSK